MYVFKNPQNQTVTSGSTFPRPWRFLRIENPSYMAFSTGTRFLLAQSGQKIVMYDAEDVQTYSYVIAKPIEPLQSHVMWNDQFHLSYVSQGSLVIQDYDNRNVQTLQAANGQYPPIYSGNGRVSYALVTNENGSTSFVMTPFTIETN